MPPSFTVLGVSSSSVPHAISHTDTHPYPLLVLEQVPNLLLGLWGGLCASQLKKCELIPLTVNGELQEFKRKDSPSLSE